MRSDRRICASARGYRWGIAVAAWLVPALVSAAARDPALQLPLPRIIDQVLVFGTYMGGSLDEQLVGVGLDDGRNVDVVGTTASNDFPTVPSLPHPTPPPKLVFVSKFDPTGSTLLSSIVFGGFTTDPDVNGTLTAAAVDGAGNVYLTGGTPGGLPTLNAAQPTYAGGGDAFVAKVDATGA